MLPVLLPPLLLLLLSKEPGQGGREGGGAGATHPLRAESPVSPKTGSPVKDRDGDRGLGFGGEPLRGWDRANGQEGAPTLS